ncbi:putative anti-sigma regulatory factor, serine/threonine protein kinase [alpha proteobacterium BAL199]|jgi:serine/threonine-protein kinase RsbW|nr:putative anti-sigma regulatory factor, serine/threonine protein kinase [alpha proteobacterium BAL199]
MIVSPESGIRESASSLLLPDVMVPTETLRLASQISEIRRLALAVEKFAARHGVQGNAAHHIILAADELITNAIEHNPPPPDLQMTVMLRLERKRLIMEISYQGTPFDPTVETKAPELDAPIEDRPIGGLGVHFAKTLLDGLSYVRRQGTNHLTLTKNL